VQLQGCKGQLQQAYAQLAVTVRNHWRWQQPLSVYVSNAVSLSLYIVCVSIWMILCVTRVGCTDDSHDQLRPRRGSCGRVQRGGVRTVRLGRRFDRSHLRGIGWRYVKKKVKFKSAHFFKVAHKNLKFKSAQFFQVARFGSQ